MNPAMTPDPDAQGKGSAPYGQACANCVKAKCRCLVKDRDVCERCHRLDKECISSGSVRKRKARTPATSKKSKLEDKIDEVVSLLRTQNTAASTASSEEPFVLTPDSIIPSAIGRHNATAHDRLTEEQLTEFRLSYLQYFPFVLLASTTAEQLQLECPLLSLAIRTVCTKAISRQKKLSKELRELLASDIMVKGERSMDILMSLIVTITWSTFFTHGKQFLAITCGTAKCVVGDLRLDRPATPAGCPSIGPPGHVENKEARTSEGSRALIAVFTLCAIGVAATFKADPMPWSSQLEEACDGLSRDNEYEGDGVLVATARLARVALSAGEVSRRTSEDPNAAQYALLAIEPLKLALDNCKSSITSEQLQHYTVVAALHSAEVSIFELALFPSSNHSQTFMSLSFDFKRIENLMACLQTCKSCHDQFFLGDITSITAPSMLTFPYCIKILHKLSTFKEAGWDPTIVRQTVDIIACMEHAAVRAERANAKFKQETGEDSVFALAAENMRASVPSWRVAFESSDAVEQDTVNVAWNGGDAGDMALMDLPSDFWLPATFNF